MTLDELEAAARVGEYVLLQLAAAEGLLRSVCKSWEAGPVHFPDSPLILHHCTALSVDWYERAKEVGGNEYVLSL